MYLSPPLLDPVNNRIFYERLDTQLHYEAFLQQPGVGFLQLIGELILKAELLDFQIALHLLQFIPQRDDIPPLLRLYLKKSDKEVTIWLISGTS